MNKNSDLYDISADLGEESEPEEHSHDKLDMENIPLGIFIIDPDSKLLYKNKAAREKMTVQFVSKVDKCNPDSQTQNKSGSNKNPGPDNDLLKEADSLLFTEYESFLENHFNSEKDDQDTSEADELLLGKIGHEINNFLTVFQLRTEMMKMSHSDAEKVSMNIGQLFRNIRHMKHYASNLLYIGRSQHEAPTKIELIKFFDDFINQPEISSIIDEYELNYSKYPDQLTIHSDQDTLSTLFLNGLILGRLFIPTSPEVKVRFGTSEYYTSISFNYRTESFPKNEFRNIHTSDSLTGIKLSSLNVAMMTLINASRVLNAKIELYKISDNETALKILIPKD